MNLETKSNAAKTTSWPGATPFFRIPFGAAGVSPVHEFEPPTARSVFAACEGVNTHATA